LTWALSFGAKIIVSFPRVRKLTYKRKETK